MKFCLNHMTAPNLDWQAFLDLAIEVGATGIEFRNDLSIPLFSGENPKTIGAAVKASGLTLYGLSQVYPFNDFSDEIAMAVSSLIDIAKRCGAPAISLIPRNDGIGLEAGIRQQTLRQALQDIKPMLDGTGVIGLIEPLGFERSSLRSKREAIDAIESVNGEGVFKLVHDTFHHHLAQETEFFPSHTAMVHVSGVVDTRLDLRDMEDAHRVLVNEADRLGNLAQLKTLRKLGYDGPISMESFSPEIHRASDISNQIRASFEFLKKADS